MRRLVWIMGMLLIGSTSALAAPASSLAARISRADSRSTVWAYVALKPSGRKRGKISALWRQKPASTCQQV